MNPPSPGGELPSPLHGICPKRLETAQGPIEYADFGEGPVVVTIHGAMGGWDQSALLARSALGGSCRVVAISRPGYLGTPLRSGASPAQQADLLAALLAGLGIAHASVVAISGGGPCALAFALRHPDQCTGLVLISTCGVKNPLPIPFAFRLLLRLARVPWVVRAMQRRALGDFDRTMARSIQDAATRRRLQGEPEVMALFRTLSASTFVRMAARTAGTRNDIELARTAASPLEEVAVPTLIVHGTADRLVPFEQHARALAARIPGARLLALQGGEHVALFTHRDLVRREVGAFLEEAEFLRSTPADA